VANVPTRTPTALASMPTPAATPTPEPSATAVPTASPSPKPEATPRYYRIKPGDQLSRIARRFNVTLQELLAANPQISDPDQIVPGQRILIPAPGSQATPAP
jgi:LysM repeat protein